MKKRWKKNWPTLNESYLDQNILGVSSFELGQYATTPNSNDYIY